MGVVGIGMHTTCYGPYGEQKQEFEGSLEYTQHVCVVLHLDGM